jgi:hypothetical protein
MSFRHKQREPRHEEAGVDTVRLCEQLGRNTLQTAFFGSSDSINLFILRISANFVLGTRESAAERGPMC